MSPHMPRPVIGGAAQIIQRVEDPREAIEPLGLMEEAIRKAAQDAGAPALVESIDAIFVPQGLWRYGDPGRLLADRLGCPGARTMAGAISGHIVQLLVNRACQQIASGQSEVIAIVGAESENSKRRLLRRNEPLHWDDEIAGEPDAHVGGVKYLKSEDEKRARVLNPTTVFSLCDTSMRSARGETPAQHRDRISNLYEKMSAVASKNPYAWIQREVPANEIRNPSESNRMVSYPYMKLMTSNISVDQGAALIVCSTEAARRYGIADEKWVYLDASTEMSHTILLSERDQLHRHPGQVLAANRVLERAENETSDLDFIDLYTCFPFAVQAGAEALGVGLDPVPSLTGGMTFFGGPFGNYVLHSKAAMVEKLRANPGTTGVIGSVGGAFAHFSYGLYSTDPGTQAGPLIEDVSDEFASMPRRAYREGHAGDVTIESYTVHVAHSGPRNASFAALTPGGERVWGLSEDGDLLSSLLDDEDACGRAATIREGRITLR